MMTEEFHTEDDTVSFFELCQPVLSLAECRRFKDCVADLWWKSMISLTRTVHASSRSPPQPPKAIGAGM